MQLSDRRQVQGPLCPSRHSSCPGLTSQCLECHRCILKGKAWDGGWSPHPRAPWTGPNRGASISEGTAQGSLHPECRGVSSGAPPTPHMAEEGGPTPKRKKHRRRGGSQAARGSAGGLAAFSFENRDTIRRFDHFYFRFYASILAVLSRELGGGGEKHIFLYHF